jgi:prepilin-type N-terminal cleavage/methylation domain-containing protein
MHKRFKLANSFKLQKRQSGFTIIELLIVIVVIGILAAIVISTFSGIQVKQRNSKRQTDIQAIQTQLESFYSQNGYYPSLSNINSVSWRDKNMTRLSSDALVDPSAVGKYSIDPQLAAKPGVKVYSYEVTNSNGGSCEKTDTDCAKYTLAATFEGSVNGQSSYVKQNLD